MVYAQAWCNQEWIKAGPGKSQGNKATIPLFIEVPPRPGETLQAEVTIQGNGKQQFVVPLTLAVVAGPAAAAAPPAPPRTLPLGWLIGAAGLVLVLVLGIVAFLLGAGGKGAEEPPPVVDPRPPAPPPQPPQQPAKNEAWWASVPGTRLAAVVNDIHNSVPGEAAVIDGLGVTDEAKRSSAYEKFAAQVPKLVPKLQPKMQDALRDLLAECFAFDPSDYSLMALRQGLRSQFPSRNAAFGPEGKEDVERGYWALQVFLAALSQKNLAKHEKRVKNLVGDLAEVFPGLDATVPPAQLKAEAQKWFAERCYKNTLPTAAKDIDRALALRDDLLRRFAADLPPAVRGPVDVALVEAGLARRGDLWPKFELILKACLESNDLATGLRIVELYKQATPAVAPQLEGVLAAKWKLPADTKLTQAARAEAFQKSLLRHHPGQDHVQGAACATANPDRQCPVVRQGGPEQ